MSRKIINDEKLNESTLRALQEEKERQLRFIKESFHATLKEVESRSRSSSLLPTTASASSTDLNSIGLKSERRSPLNSSLNNVSDQSICIIDELEPTPKQIKNEPTVEPKIEYNLIDDDEDFGNRSNACKNYDLDEDDDEDDDGDCQILSESEHLEEENAALRKRLRGVHMNDEFNRPDENGQVLVNVNHPAEDADIHLIPYLARHVKAHQIGAIRFIYDNIVESLSRVKEKDSGFGCILA